jgi:hypothetical protein
MSYYNNAPRLHTPSAFKVCKSNLPVESFGAIAGTDVETPPDPVNTCHRSRGTYLQHSHPRTLAARASSGPRVHPALTRRPRTRRRHVCAIAESGGR